MCSNEECAAASPEILLIQRSAGEHGYMVETVEPCYTLAVAGARDVEPSYGKCKKERGDDNHCRRRTPSKPSGKTGRENAAPP